MFSHKSVCAFSHSVIFLLMFTGLSALAQLPWKFGEQVEIKRVRPADVHLANQTINVRVNAIDAQASHMTERLRKLIINGTIGNNKTLRETNSAPQIQVECTITRYDHREKTEEKKLLLVKDKGTFKIINFTLEASYKVVRTRDNFTYFADNVSLPYSKEFQVGTETAPDKSQIEDTLMNQIVKSILSRLTNTEEKLKVRLMRKDDLSRFARLAQGGQWDQYIESITSLPEKSPDKNGRSEFEGDRHYNLCIAYEALAYKNMWTDQNKATFYFGLADTAIRKAQQMDPREKEYVNAQTRMLQGKQYFDVIKERFPSATTIANVENEQGSRGTPPHSPDNKDPSGEGAKTIHSSGMTNQDVIRMFRVGMSEALIIEQILAAKEKRFDTSPNGLIELTNGGVSEKVIRVIIKASAPARPKGTRRRSGAAGF